MTTHRNRKQRGRGLPARRGRAIGSRPLGGRRGRRPTSTGLDRGVWWGLLGGLVFAGGLFFLWASSGAQDPGTAAEGEVSLAYRADRPAVAPTVPPDRSGAWAPRAEQSSPGSNEPTAESRDDESMRVEASGTVSAAREDVAQEGDVEGEPGNSERAESPRNEEEAPRRRVYNPDEEPAETEGSVVYVEVSDPLVDPLAGRVDDSPEPFVNPLKKTKGQGDAATGENRLFTLQLSGKLGSQPIDPNDQQTWARLAYFLQEHSPDPFHLVYPGGHVPLVMMKGPRERLLDGESAKKEKQAPGPLGDRSNPSYRIVLNVAVRSAGKITFFGKILATKYTCEFSGRVEKRRKGKFRTLKTFSVSERATPSEDRPLSEEQYVRQVYDASLKTLVRKLKTLPPLAGP